MKKIISITLVAILLLCGNLCALDLQAAKDQGLVGETTSGYLAPVDPNNSQAAAIAQSINAQRKQQYQQIAQRNNAPLQSVEQLAGKKAIEKTPSGQFIQIKGQWRKK